MSEQKKLKRVTLKVEVLMEEEDIAEGMSLADIEYECIDGGWSYEFDIIDETMIIGDDAIEEACNKQGTAVGFFFPEED